MLNKKLILILVVLIGGFAALIVASKLSQSDEPLIGVQSDVQESKHIGRGETHAAYNSSPASSGPHYDDAGAPVAWGIYIEEIPAEVYLHNMEHGGILITYNPKLLPADQLTKLRALFASPSSNEKFNPRKFILTPQSDAKQAIELASWGWTLGLDGYDEATLMKFFTQHAGKAPEPAAGPTGAPINQAR